MNRALQTVPSCGEKPPGLDAFRNAHEGETIVVCGCGPSLLDLASPGRYVTIGVNDVGRLFDPTYLVVVNPRSQFKSDRFRYVEASNAKVLFTQLDLGTVRPPVVRFRLGKYGGTDSGAADTLHYTQNSPYVAVCLAAYMGARRIGLIGVDLTDDHFFARTGRHSLAGRLREIDAQYGRLTQALQARGVQLVNLSTISRLTSLPKVDPPLFLDGQMQVNPCGAATATPPLESALKVVSYSTTPVAGVPAILARCITARTPHRARCVWSDRKYGNGVIFDGDIEWTTSPREAAAALADADVVVVHNGKVDPRHRQLLAGKPVITLAHNYLWNVDQSFVQAGMPGAVVGQYQATLPEFRDWSIVPNPIPLWEHEYQPDSKADLVTIAYTPSGRHERYAAGHRLYWHGKGYETTIRVLDRLKHKYPVRLNVIRGRQIAHREALLMKRRSHIVIDECVTGSYHRNSLEGLATGCVVINSVGLLPAVVDALQRCTGDIGPSPFVQATLDELEGVLTTLIESGPAALERRGMAARGWMEEHWDFARQWQTHWMSLVERARHAASRDSDRTRVRPPHATWLQRVRNTPSANVPTFWTCQGRTGNFGDMLSPVIVEALSGRRARHESLTPRLLAVGSLLKFARSGDVVWGTGFISAADACDPRIRVLAVRGPLTRRRLLELGVDCPEIYGDPALLLPWIYRLPVSERRGIGVIPHYVDAARVGALVKDSALRIIDIRAGIERVLREVSRCEIVLSSSLHGCVIGDAYGIPTAWVRISDKVVGGAYKFEDYYAGTGREAAPVDWRTRIDIDAGVRAARGTPPPRVDLDALVRAFPLRASRIQGLCDLTAREPAAPPPAVPRSTRAVRPARVAPSQVPADAQVGPTGENGTPRALEKLGERLAIFTSATEDYVGYSVTTLRSFMRHAADRPFDYYLLGRSFSRASRELLNRYGIRYLELDLRAVFRRSPHDCYPSECFWIFKGPEIFNELGYRFSLSVDGDVLCNRHLDLDWLPDVEHLAGIHRGTTVAGFLSGLGGYPQLKRAFCISDAAERRDATNSGVVFYNNKNLADLGFFERVVHSYRGSEAAGVRRNGDDSTLALFLAVHPEVALFRLDRMWNAYHGLFHRSSFQAVGEGHLARWITEARIVHFAALKPWKALTHFPNGVLHHFVMKWRESWPNVNGGRPSFRPPVARRRVFERPARPAHQPYPVRCYWYRGATPNFGDELAPYLVRKIARVPPRRALQQRPADPRALSDPVLLSIGSILRLCGPNTVVWGSGIRNIDQDVASARRFVAVRGPLTRERLRQLGYDCPERYGDPALLLPRYFRPAVKKQYALGIIPHPCDLSAVIRLYARLPDVLIIDLSTPHIEVVVRRILSCRATVSSALHGLVMSVAYGIPTRWVRLTDRITGDGSKFYDFFASLNPLVAEALDRQSVTLPAGGESLDAYRPVHVNGVRIPPQDLMSMTFRHEVTIDLDALLGACPIDERGWKAEVL